MDRRHDKPHFMAGVPSAGACAIGGLRSRLQPTSELRIEDIYEANPSI
jgi:hypothetical protein